MRESTEKARGRARILRTTRIVILAVLIILLFSFLDNETRIFDYIEQLTYGDRLEVSALCSPRIAADAIKNVKVVSISDDTYAWAAHGGSVESTLPRSCYVSLVRRLTSYGAKVITFDLLFDRARPGDDDLAKAMKQSGRVVLGCEDNGDSQLKIVTPERLFINSGARLGLARVHFDVDSPQIDDIEPEVETDNGLMPTLSVETVRVARGIADLPITADKPSSTAIPEMPIVTDFSYAYPTFKIRYIGSASTGFPLIPLENIVGADAATDEFYRQHSVFRDKVVIVGDTTKLSGDLRMTPLDQMPGVVVQANAIATLLDKEFIHEATPLQEMLILAIFVTLTTVLATLWSLRRVAVLMVMVLPIFFLVNVWLFVANSYYFHLVGPSVAIILTAVFVLLERALVEENEKSRMRQLLGRYVNPRMADYILLHPDLIGGEGKVQLGTMLFTDVRGFTKLSEALTPQELVRHMNEYFETMIHVVFKYDGAAVNLIGDAMLVVFGIPVPSADHADKAIRAAIEMQSATADLRKKWGVDDASGLSSGIGINTGEVVVGEIGGSELRSFTVYGLQVNIASRVETLNKTLGTNILITRSTFESLQNAVTVKGPTKAPVKGVAEPLDVFEVIWDDATV